MDASRTRLPYYENNTKNPYRDDVKKRQLWRLYKYKTDEEMLETFDGTVLVNRCCLDWLIYTETFRKLGWLSRDDYDFLIDKYESLFGDTVPDILIFLNPPAIGVRSGSRSDGK